MVAGGGVLQLDPGFEQIVLAEVGGAFVAVPCEGKTVERDVVERHLGADSSREEAVGEGQFFTESQSGVSVQRGGKMPAQGNRLFYVGRDEREEVSARGFDQGTVARVSG